MTGKTCEVPAKLLSGAPGSGEILGQLFESLVTLCVRARATAAGLRTSHLRTRNGDHEIDLIVENTAGRVVVTTGEYAYRRDDGVAVIPLGLPS